MRHRHLACVAAILAASIAGSAAEAHDPHRGVQAGGSSPATAAEVPFLEENAAAMDRMMAGMDVAPTGDLDADFTAMMIPHHQGAIDMAVAYLRYGTNPQLRRLAQEIVVEQQQEIAAMRLAVGQSLPPSAPVPTQPAAASPAEPAATPPAAPIAASAHQHDHGSDAAPAPPAVARH
ncbi:DUF305 domain-containing protein [Acuticoccus sediminis]|uniref:DUF305 domain-containing protein n=1 Tax=Acuticoccus sediminis TaxID=2184697 RepID=A0A8B2NUD1_9HYPH|nr:DUF305 domain-containing protein [Acuticoccus sediminis]RAI03798.1 DUF305 domain-containing protein [Acuticoccus sediminis]